MNILEIISKKKNNIPLNQSEINFFIENYTKTQIINDYQAAALLMAIAINGLNESETFYLTKAMLESGSTIEFKNVKGIKIDKHSTGGVADKVSIILGPICAALGFKVAKLSGKGLGHTGGTIDKMESIHMNTSLAYQEYIKLLKDHGIFITAQTTDIVPSDKKLYALRNATSTVASLPLIASSIVSKKLALKTDYIFIDVKVGDGGFCKTKKEAIELSHIMIKLFHKFKRKAIIHITDMTQPLGRCIGNAIEVKESIQFLKNQCDCERLKKVIYEFAIDILVSTKKAKDHLVAKKMIDDIIRSGQALKKFYEWVKAQNGNINQVLQDKFFNPKYKLEIKSPKNGYISYLSTKTIGLISFELGAGRIRKEDEIDYQAGIYLNKIKNEYVKSNEVIATLYSSSPINKKLKEIFLKNSVFSNQKFPTSPVILGVIK